METQLHLPETAYPPRVSQECKEFTDFVLSWLNFPDVSKEELTQWTQMFFPILYSSREDFKVTLEQVASWFNSEEFNVFKLLQRNFKENKDFRIVYQKRGLQGRGAPKRTIFLSNDCFQELCQLSRSSKGKLCRRFYIAIASAYREYFDRKRRSRISHETEEERDFKQKPLDSHTLPQGPGCYIIQIDYKGRITYKVGATENIRRRFAELSNNHIHGKLSLRKWEPCEEDPFFESCLHAALRKYEVENEMFEVDYAKIEGAFEVCRRKMKEVEIEVDSIPSSTSPDPFEIHAQLKIPKKSRRDRK